MLRFITSTFFCALSAVAVAAQTAPDPDKLIRATLHEGWRQTDGTHIAGLELTLAPGWQTYWRAPGEGGIPPLFSWQGSGNIAAQATVFPAPQVFEKNGIRTIGYKDRVILPLRFTPVDPAAPIRLRGRVDVGVCQDVCIPVSLTFDATLPEKDSPRDDLIWAALNAQPESAAGLGMKPARCAVDPAPDGLWVTATLEGRLARSAEVVVFEHPDRSLWISEAALTPVANGVQARSEFVSVTGAPFPVNRSDIRMTVFGAGRVVDFQGCVAG